MLNFVCGRQSVFLATVLSTVSLIFVVIILPLAHLHFQRKISILLDVGQNCKLQSRDLWRQLPSLTNKRRDARATGGNRADYGKSYNAAQQMAPMGGICCACRQGKPGAPGKAGQPGRPGKDGNNGFMGWSGRPGKYIPGQQQSGGESCQMCPPGPPGPPGLAGPKGQRGAAGQAGKNGKAGENNRPGPPGPPGQRGEPGTPGQRGPNGDPGRVLNGAPPGPPGPPGPIGARGAPGSAGKDGEPGMEGMKGMLGMVGRRGDYGAFGMPGPQGSPGMPGMPGNCGHCQQQEVHNAPIASPASSPPPSKTLAATTNSPPSLAPDYGQSQPQPVQVPVQVHPAVRTQPLPPPSQYGQEGRNEAAVKAYGQHRVEVKEEDNDGMDSSMPAMPIGMAAPGPEKEPPIGTARLSTIGRGGNAGLGSYAAFLGGGQNDSKDRVKIHSIPKQSEEIDKIDEEEGNEKQQEEQQQFFRSLI